jgi:hypothetical protein
MNKRRKMSIKNSKTNIDMSLGDAIDRITILIRKIQFGEDAAYKEFEYLTEAIDKLNIEISGAILAAIIRVAYSNFEVWNRENAFRRGEDMSAEAVKQMMIEVRDFNSRRIQNKNEINRITEMGFREFKIQHRSR